jgi:hypothetical protein
MSTECIVIFLLRALVYRLRIYLGRRRNGGRALYDNRNHSREALTSRRPVLALASTRAGYL